MSAVSVPGYEVLDPLGRGGYGTVYRARQVTIDREVAIKIDNRLILDDRDRRRFLREVRAAGRLSGHPHVVEIYDAGILPDARPYLVMELCPGGSLADRGPLPVREVVEVGVRIADALAAAHDLGVLHRDIKPGNILVKRYGTVGLADFGLAAVVEAGRDSSVTLAALTPAYAAPEAFHLHPPTVQSDVYALTATLYTLLTGAPPRFPAEGDLSVPEIMRRHDAPVGDIPDIPPQLMAILRRGLAKDPAHRHADAAALGADLSRLPLGDSGPRHAVTQTVTTVATPRPSAPRVAPPPAAPGGPPSLARVAPSPRGPGAAPGGPSSPPHGSPVSGAAFGAPPGAPSSPPYGSSVPPGPPYGPPSVRSGPTSRSRRPLLLAGAALVAVLLAVAGVWFVLRDSGPADSGDRTAAGPGGASDPTSASDTQRYGVPTVTDGCPAAAVPDARARCTKRPQCWSGIVMIQGQLTSIRELPCAESHVYETFAIAALPAAIVDAYQDELAADPSVRRVCSPTTLLASRYGDAIKYGEDEWSIEVLPPTPDDRAAGRDIYRCVATLTGVEDVTGSAFRPAE